MGPQILVFSIFAPRLGASSDFHENDTFTRCGKTACPSRPGWGVSFEGGTKIASKSLRKFASILDAFLLRFGVPKSPEIEPQSLPKRSWSQLGVGSRFRRRFGMAFVAKMAQILVFFNVFLHCFCIPFPLCFGTAFSLHLCPPLVFLALPAKRRTC